MLHYVTLASRFVLPYTNGPHGVRTASGVDVCIAEPDCKIQSSIINSLPKFDKVDIVQFLDASVER